MTYLLRSYFRSSCSWRVRIALAWKGLEYRTEPVHLLRDGGEQYAEPHRTLNPMAQVPVLLADGEPIAQSLAILEYLEDRHPEPPLLPPDALGRARVRQMAEVINSGIQPLQNLRVLRTLHRTWGLDSDGTQSWARGWIEDGFAALETLVARHGGRCCHGDEVSFADLCLVPQLYNARRFEVDLTPFPRLLAVESALEPLDAFRVAHPSAQPDAPADP